MTCLSCASTQKEYWHEGTQRHTGYVSYRRKLRSICRFSCGYARARPGQLDYGSARNGGLSHLVPKIFKTATGMFMVHIPCLGSAPAFTDLMGGRVQFMGEPILRVANCHKQGKVRALAVTSKKRNPALTSKTVWLRKALIRPFWAAPNLQHFRQAKHRAGRWQLMRLVPS